MARAGLPTIIRLPPQSWVSVPLTQGASEEAGDLGIGGGSGQPLGVAKGSVHRPIETRSRPAPEMGRLWKPRLLDAHYEEAARS